jgi:hypothetical protein
MKKYLFIIALFAFETSRAQLNLQNISVGNPTFVSQENGKYTLNENSDFKKMEDRFTYGNLRIYMLRANETLRNEYKSIGNHTSLQEALKAKKIKVTELGDGTVNTLEIENISKDTIMILAGEVVTGGKQDRVIGQDVMLPPKSGKVQVSVFCVEHGRWTPQNSGYQFNGTIGVATGQVRRKAVVDKNQGKVWEEVADATKKNKSQTSSGTYAALQNSDALNTEVAKYMKHYEKLMLEDSNYIGFVAVTGDTIISADLFATNQMFRKQSPQLIKSAAVDAITYGSVVAIAASRVMAFLSEFLQDEDKQETQVMQSGTMLKSNGQKIHLNYYKK